MNKRLAILTVVGTLAAYLAVQIAINNYTARLSKCIKGEESGTVCIHK